MSDQLIERYCKAYKALHGKEIAVTSKGGGKNGGWYTLGDGASQTKLRKKDLHISVQRLEERVAKTAYPWTRQRLRDIEKLTELIQLANGCDRSCSVDKLQRMSTLADSLADSDLRTGFTEDGYPFHLFLERLVMRAHEAKALLPKLQAVAESTQDANAAKTIREAIALLGGEAEKGGA